MKGNIKRGEVGAGRRRGKIICLSLDILVPSERQVGHTPPECSEDPCRVGPTRGSLRGFGSAATENPAVEDEDERQHLDTPFSGDWSAACWNAQGLLASDITKQREKMRRAARLAMHRDFLVITETHGNVGKCRGLRRTRGNHAFWSNGPNGEAGVGIWIKEDFLNREKGNSGGQEWIDVEPGRAAVLRCWGAQGKVQIGMVYLQTGNSGGRAKRISTMRRMATELKKGAKP